MKFDQIAAWFAAFQAQRRTSGGRETVTPISEGQVSPSCSCILSEQQILSFIKNARSELEQADNLFNELTDSADVDYASYNLLAAKAKYESLMKLAKEQGLSAGGRP